MAMGVAGEGAGEGVVLSVVRGVDGGFCLFLFFCGMRRKSHVSTIHELHDNHDTVQKNFKTKKLLLQLLTQ